MRSGCNRELPASQRQSGPILVEVSKPLARSSSTVVDFSGVDDVLAVVRSGGGRATLSRRLLLKVLFDAEGPMTAEELAVAVQNRAPDVHMSTIYRNLDELQRLGVIVHSHLGHGPATYQLASLAHAHFLCEECGATIEAPDELFQSLARRAQSRFGFSIDPRHFAIVGRCAACT
jgi:Fur family ferric uptake transcriptional regulator